MTELQRSQSILQEKNQIGNLILTRIEKYSVCNLKFVVCAGVIILGSAILLRIRISRGNCMQQELQLAELQLRFPSELIMGTASFFNATLEPFMQGLRRSSFVSAGDASECNDGSSQRLGQPRERKRVGNGREPGGFVQP
jgi:hypothetical protein